MSLDFLKDVPAFKDLVLAIKTGEQGLRISGLAAPAKPYFFSMLAQNVPKRIVHIQPAALSLQEFEERCRFFLAELGSSKEVLALPPLTDNPFEETGPSLEAASTRMKFYYGLVYGSPALVVTNLFGLLKPFPAPHRLPRLFLRLEKNSFYERDRLLQTLAQYGYVREDLVSFRGEYAGRGGIVDVFSPWNDTPYRIEYSGDEIV